MPDQGGGYYRRPPTEAEMQRFQFYGEPVILASVRYVSARWDMFRRILIIRTRQGEEREISDIDDEDALEIISMGSGDVDRVIEHYLHHAQPKAKTDEENFLEGEKCINPHSSFVTEICYRAAEKKLEVEFCDGFRAAWLNVHESEALAFFHYYSKGKWANANLGFTGGPGKGGNTYDEFIKGRSGKGSNNCPPNPYPRRRGNRGRRKK